jgi:hypothetical protein
MKAQANTQKCPLAGSTKSTEKSAAQVNIIITHEFNAGTNFRIMRGLTTMMNKYINPLIQPRYFLLLDGEVLDGQKITGYAIVDAQKKAEAISDVKEILCAAYPGATDFYIHSVIKGHKAARIMEANIKRDFPERVINGGNHEKA